MWWLVDCPSCCVYIVKWSIVVVLADLHFYVARHVLLFLAVMMCGFVDVGLHQYVAYLKGRFAK